MPLPGPEWTDERPAVELVDRRHKRQWEAGRAAVLAWLGHPAVRREVEAQRPALMELGAPLEFRDQIDVTFKIARLLDVNCVWPDGSQWDNPYEGASEELTEATAQAAPALIAALQQLAEQLQAAGAPVDSNDFGTLLVLAQISLVPIDLGLPIVQLLDGLNTLPPGWIDRDAALQGQASATASRYGRTARFVADLSALAEGAGQAFGPPRLRSPYAGGRPRQLAVEHGQLRRRRALQEVLAAHPDVTPGKIRATWGAGPSTAGGLLRVRLALQPHDRPAGESTLRADLRELRR